LSVIYFINLVINFKFQFHYVSCTDIINELLRLVFFLRTKLWSIKSKSQFFSQPLLYASYAQILISHYTSLLNIDYFTVHMLNEKKKNSKIISKSKTLRHFYALKTFLKVLLMTILAYKWGRISYQWLLTLLPNWFFF